VTAVDFNPAAIKLARETANFMKLSTKFIAADLFEYEQERLFDAAVSFGVLHHTADCMGGAARLCNSVKKGGTVAVALYHKYGRAPFLQYFDELKKQGLTNAQLYNKYKELDDRTIDMINSGSWFRDQVLHPHETRHTLKEICEVFDKCRVTLTSTSINNFESIKNLDELFEKEKDFYAIGQQKLREKQYYPGFYVAIGIKL
jgi:cyclopropane fatty-acyl-phospholipid synthase-like methyltransferase